MNCVTTEVITMNSVRKTAQVLATVALVSTCLLPGFAGAVGNARQCLLGDPGFPNCPPDLPEPATLVLVGLGLAGLIVSRRNKK